MFLLFKQIIVIVISNSRYLNLDGAFLITPDNSSCTICHQSQYHRINKQGYHQDFHPEI